MSDQPKVSERMRELVEVANRAHGTCEIDDCESILRSIEATTALISAIAEIETERDALKSAASRKVAADIEQIVRNLRWRSYEVGKFGSSCGRFELEQTAEYALLTAIDEIEQRAGEIDFFASIVREHYADIVMPTAEDRSAAKPSDWINCAILELGNQHKRAEKAGASAETIEVLADVIRKHHADIVIADAEGEPKADDDTWVVCAINELGRQRLRAEKWKEAAVAYHKWRNAYFEWGKHEFPSDDSRNALDATQDRLEAATAALGDEWDEAVKGEE